MADGSGILFVIFAVLLRRRSSRSVLGDCRRYRVDVAWRQTLLDAVAALRRSCRPGRVGATQAAVPPSALRHRDLQR